MINLRSTLRRLAKRHGTSLDYYHVGDNVVDYRQGTAVPTLGKTTIPRGIILPAALTRSISGGFTYDTTSTKIYMPAETVVPVKGDYFIVNSKRFNILEIHDVAGDYILEVLEHEGDVGIQKLDVFINIPMIMRLNVS